MVGDDVGRKVDDGVGATVGVTVGATVGAEGQPGVAPTPDEGSCRQTPHVLATVDCDPHGCRNLPAQKLASVASHVNAVAVTIVALPPL